MDFGTYGTVHLLWRLSGLQCSITRTTWAAASRTSTSRSTGRIPTPVGVCIFQAFLICTSPLLIFYFLEWRRPLRVEFYFTFLQQAQLHATTSGLHLRKSKGLTPTRLLLLYSLLSFYPVAGWREQGSGPTPAQHQGRRRSVRWTECVTSPLGQGGACQASFLTRHTQRPRHKKVSDDIDSETHTCTKHNTKHKWELRERTLHHAQHEARHATCSYTSLCCSRLTFRSPPSSPDHLPFGDSECTVYRRCLPGKLSDATHSTSPTQKGERRHRQ